MHRVESVDAYIAAHPDRAAELEKLRSILAATPLVETIKWGAPCYTHNGKNIVGLGAYKAYAGLWFHQGALLDDPDGHLINAQEGKTKALRQWRFTSASRIKARPIKAFVTQAIALVEQGKEIKPDRAKTVEIPPELAAAFKEDATLKKAFNALTPGKQREYAAHIAEAKRDATRATRLEKIVPMIKTGAGLHDKYRNC